MLNRYIDGGRKRDQIILAFAAEDSAVIDAPLARLRTATLRGEYTVSNLWQIDSAAVNDSGYNCG